jgi:alpha-glucosidase (family GH31 glycosyl hydrolase)
MELRFKKAEHLEFCVRNRYLSHSQDFKIIHEVIENSLKIDENILSFHLKNILETHAYLSVTISFHEKDVIRFKITEINPLHVRYEMKNLNLSQDKPILNIQSQTSTSLSLTSLDICLELIFSPFSIKVLKSSEVKLVINDRSLMNFERYREKNDILNHSESNLIDATGLPLQQNFWNEKFGSFEEPAIRGPCSIGLDFTFIGKQLLSGLAEHTDSVLLSDTHDAEPYRLYNLDVFCYDIDSKASIYGCVPFIFSKNCGIYWANPSETFVDISTDQINDNRQVHWMSECGNLEFYLLFDESPLKLIEKFTLSTGPACFPPRFSLGYHQCRWNYYSQEEVMILLHNFRKYSIPVDVFWLDIEHTDNKNYFTWDLNQFPDPVKLQDTLALNGKRLVTIVDPHFRSNPTSKIGSELQSLNFFIKSQSGEDFTGGCWTGTSSWVDFFQTPARQKWSSFYNFNLYPFSTSNLQIWNDMNEPSVFGSCETTLPKSSKHSNSLEHREVHNLYGLMMTKATFKGLLERSSKKLRPFLLTRSFFAGSQKFGAVWTGDNKSTWEYLKVSVPMCLSLASCGLSHCGADVGGFFGEASAELAVRWYQLGAFLPFFRGHAHLDTKNREPWKFPEKERELIRESILMRYRLIPYWYTIFYQYHRFGTPVIRSLFLQCPDLQMFPRIDEEFFVGPSLIVFPVVSKKSEYFEGFLPPGRWFDFYHFKEVFSGNLKVECFEDKIPVFLNGGQTVFMQESRLSTQFMNDSPFEIIVALDFNGCAQGTCFLDDGESFEYQEGKFILGNLEASRVWL